MEIAFAVENDKAMLHLVKTGRAWGGNLEVLSGLEAGDRIVVEGGAQLVDGQPLK